MSTYGTAVVIDSPDEARAADLGAGLAAERADVHRATSADGWTRLTAAWEEIEVESRVSDLLATLGTGRAVIAEDHDEFGALWVVLSAEGGVVTTVHRRYLLNADPDDHSYVAELLRAIGGDDPRDQDEAGERAAAAAAALFGIDPAAMVEAERGSGAAHLRMGEVGGPFPWWQALGLTWPGTHAGEPVAPEPDPTRVLRMNAATWPRFAREHLLPRLPDAEDWEVTAFGMLRRPTTWLLRGVTWAGSSGDRLHGNAVVLPLYRPTEHVHHMHALRLADPRGQRGFDLPVEADQDRLAADMAAAVRQQAADHLDRLGTLEAYAALLESEQAIEVPDGRRRWWPGSRSRWSGARYAEELAYTLVLLDRVPEALHQLELASRVSTSAPAWEQEQARRAALIAGLLPHDWQGALAQLDRWAAASAAALGVPR